MSKVEACAISAVIAATVSFVITFGLASSACDQEAVNREDRWQQEAVAHGAAEYYLSEDYPRIVKWRWKRESAGEIQLEPK